MNPAVGVIKHSLARTISVISTLLVIVGLGWAIYITVIRPHTKPNPTTTQKAETIQNITYDYTEKEMLFLGIRLWKFRIGVSVK